MYILFTMLLSKLANLLKCFLDFMILLSFFITATYTVS